jgi:hypothetical protein
MKSKKIITEIVLLLGFLFAFYILINTFVQKEWNTVASSLAVITAIIGSWSTQRIIWKQQEELEPKINIYLDLQSRKRITQFVVENAGGSSAYDVQIIWVKPLYTIKNTEIHFTSGVDNIDFKRIYKGQKYSYAVNRTEELYKTEAPNNETLDYYGFITYKKSPKSLFKIKEDFFITLEPYRNSLDFETDYEVFLNEHSNVHKDLVALNKNLKQLLTKL